MEQVLFEVARTSGVAALLATAACLALGAAGFVAAATAGGGRSVVLDRARELAAFGGGAGLLAILTAMPYRWLLGEIDGGTFASVEAAVLAVAVVYACVATALLRAGARG
jgi:hypothetical protein